MKVVGSFSSCNKQLSCLLLLSQHMFCCHSSKAYGRAYHGRIGENALQQSRLLLPKLLKTLCKRAGIIWIDTILWWYLLCYESPLLLWHLRKMLLVHLLLLIGGRILYKLHELADSLTWVYSSLSENIETEATHALPTEEGEYPTPESGEECGENVSQD